MYREGQPGPVGIVEFETKRETAIDLEFMLWVSGVRAIEYFKVTLQRWFNLRLPSGESHIKPN